MPEMPVFHHIDGNDVVCFLFQIGDPRSAFVRSWWIHSCLVPKASLSMATHPTRNRRRHTPWKTQNCKKMMEYFGAQIHLVKVDKGCEKSYEDDKIYIRI